MKQEVKRSDPDYWGCVNVLNYVFYFIRYFLLFYAIKWCNCCYLLRRTIGLFDDFCEPFFLNDIGDLIDLHHSLF